MKEQDYRDLENYHNFRWIQKILNEMYNLRPDIVPIDQFKTVKSLVHSCLSKYESKRPKIFNRTGWEDMGDTYDGLRPDGIKYEPEI